MILKNIYENIILKFWKLILFLILGSVLLLSFQIKNLTIDASSETLILENDKDLAFTRLIAKRYYSPDFLVIAYTPDKYLFHSETLKTISDITKKLLELKQVHSVNSILNVPLLQSPPRPISELLEHIPILEDPKIDKNLARLEFLNSPIYKDNLVSSDFKTTAILVNLKDDEVGMSLRNKRDFLREGIKNKNISKNEMKDFPDHYAFTESNQWAMVRNYTPSLICVSVEYNQYEVDNPNKATSLIGLVYPWAKRPAFIDRLDEFDLYDYGPDQEAWSDDDDYVYYGANVAESWFSRNNPNVPAEAITNQSTHNFKLGSIHSFL